MCVQAALACCQSLGLSLPLCLHKCACGSLYPCACVCVFLSAPREHVSVTGVTMATAEQVPDVMHHISA